MNYDKYANSITKTIVTLCNIPSPSGFTGKICNHLKKQLDTYGFTSRVTNKGSILTDLGGEGNPLVLSAHMDTLGAMVRAIKKNGRLRITQIGGYPFRYLEGVNCKIHTRDNKEFSGTFQAINPSVHVNRKLKDETRDDRNIEVVIDETIYHNQDVLALGISPGDFISIDPATVTTDSGFIKSRHLDDKAGVALLIELAAYFKEKNISLNRKVYLYFSNYEEVGHGGSSGIPGDVVEMLTVDMGAVGDDLSTNEHLVSIAAKDSAGPYDYDMTTALINLAKSHNVNYAVDIFPHYSSDARAALMAGHDIKYALVGPGVAASHGYERAHRDGLINTFRLLLAYITE